MLKRCVGGNCSGNHHHCTYYQRKNKSNMPGRACALVTVVEEVHQVHQGHQEPQLQQNPREHDTCAALGEHIFSYNEREAADQMRNTLKELVLYAGQHYSLNVSTEIENRQILVLPKPQPPAAIVTTWAAAEKVKRPTLEVQSWPRARFLLPWIIRRPRTIPTCPWKILKSTRISR